MSKLGLSYYLNDDVVALSRDLLGKRLMTRIGGDVITGGIIVETEAYDGLKDSACHAFVGRYTQRTKVLWKEGGLAYVYLIYGMYYLLNLVTAPEGIPMVVLIRALEPTDGIDLMMLRRKLTKIEPRLTAGPGLLTQALGITNEHYGASLLDDTIWVEDDGLRYTHEEIIASPRVNIGYAGDDVHLPWRFRVKGNKWTSKAK